MSKGRNQGVGGHDQRFKQASYSVQSSVPAQMCSTRQVTLTVHGNDLVTVYFVRYVAIWLHMYR